MPYRLRLLAVLAIALLIVITAATRTATTASAHPLGNFTINHHDRITASDRALTAYSVLDMAEIPAFRERQSIDANGDGNLDAAEVEAYARAKVDALRQHLVLRVNGKAESLTAGAHAVTFPPGQGGLSLLRLTVTYTAPLPSNWQRTPPTVSFDDSNDSDHLGWREIIIQAGGGVRVEQATAPSQNRSHELTAYPTDALTSPLDVRSASFSFIAAAGASADPVTTHQAVTAVRGNPDSALVRFAGPIAKDHLSAGVIILALLAAMGFEAIHALSPGHGKTIVAAYLVGSKGTARHAALLGLTVTVTHTSSVYVLGFISLYLSEYIVPERLYPWLTLASGALIVAMGLALLVARVRASGLGGRLWTSVRAALSVRRTRTRLRSALEFAAQDAGALPLALAAQHHHAPADMPHEHGAGAVCTVTPQTWMSTTARWLPERRTATASGRRIRTPSRALTASR